MAYNQSPPLPVAWEKTRSTRTSLAWWIVAVICGATAGVVGYFIAPGGGDAAFTLGGVVVGFFAPYALIVAWNLPSASTRRDRPVSR